jgi:TolA-binding protein
MCIRDRLQGQEEKTEIPPEVQQQLQQSQQMIQQLTQRIQQLDGAIQMDEVKAQKDLTRTRESDQTKERVARIAAEAEIARTRMELIKEMMKIDAAGGTAMAQEETKRLLKLADLEVASQMAPPPAPQGGPPPGPPGPPGPQMGPPGPPMGPPGPPVR